MNCRGNLRRSPLQRIDFPRYGAWRSSTTRLSEHRMISQAADHDHGRQSTGMSQEAILGVKFVQPTAWSEVMLAIRLPRRGSRARILLLSVCRTGEIPSGPLRWLLVVPTVFDGGEFGRLILMDVVRPLRSRIRAAPARSIAARYRLQPSMIRASWCDLGSGLRSNPQPPQPSAPRHHSGQTR